MQSDPSIPLPGEASSSLNPELWRAKVPAPLLAETIRRTQPLDLDAQRDAERAIARKAKPAFAARRMLQEPTPGTPVPFGEYQLIRRIGAGGMGEVFLARESKGQKGQGPRACVLKKVLPSLQENRAFLGRFLDEARVAVRLKHTNIARVYEMGDVNGEYFLTMEYVQGKTVSRFTKRLRDRKTQMPLGLILLIGERVCQGLSYAHGALDENGEPLHLVHRDLSPANVCISYRGEVKIIDFGAAQSTLKEEQTAPRVVIGNLTYMAPEQAKKQHVDHRADVYSVGVVLWELLAWHALPQKGDPIERWRKAANPSWDAPSVFSGSLPRDIDELVLKALNKDPKERFPSAEAMGEALKKARLKHAPSASEKELGELLTRVFSREKEVEDGVLRETLFGKAIDHVPTDKNKKVQFVPPTALAFEHTAVMAPAGYVPSHDDEEVTDPGRPRHVSGPKPVEPPSGRKLAIAGADPDPELTKPRAPPDLLPTLDQSRPGEDRVIGGPGESQIETGMPRVPLRDEGTPTPSLDPRLKSRLEREETARRSVNATRTSFGVTFHELTEPKIEPSLIQEIEGFDLGQDDDEYHTRADPSPSPKFLWVAAAVFFGAVGLGFLGIFIWAFVQQH